MLRIFSKSNDLSCNDYIKNIKGKTILSNLKTNYSNNRTIKTNNNKIISYLSYNDFLVITQTFYKYSNLKKNYKPPQKIIDLKTSFIFYNKILNHIQSCSFCKTNSIETFFENCKEIKNILYPYGEYFTYEIYSNLASVDLDYWCKKECIHNIYCDNNKVNESPDMHNSLSNNESNNECNNESNNESNKYSYYNTTNKMHVNHPLSIFSSNSSNKSSNESSYNSFSESCSESCSDSSSISSNCLSHTIEQNIQNHVLDINKTNSEMSISNIQAIYPTNSDVIKINTGKTLKLLKVQENNIDTNNSDNFIFINSMNDSTNRIEFVTNSLTVHKNTFNIFIAELSNSKDYVCDDNPCNDFENENKRYNVYNFIPIYINFDEFKKVFYNSFTKYFNISDIISEKNKLSNQYFETINNKVESFFITNAIKKIYIEKNNYNEMDANTLIEIEKEANNYVSLYDFNYIKNSLNLDEFIHVINKNNIEVGSEIKARIKVYYKSQKTDIPCIMYFNYILQNL